MSEIQKRALIVDDSRANRLVIGMSVKDFGYEAVDAQETGEALNYIKNFSKFDLILVDFKMPGMNGAEFIREVREMRSYRSTPIIMISSESSAERMTEAHQAGADDYIVKPFTKAALQSKLDFLRL